MGRITGMQAIQDVVEKYGSNAGNFFKLENNMESALVRFNHKDDTDLDIFVVHKVFINGKIRYIECASVDGQPCELCKAGYKATPRIFVSLFDFRDKQYKLWDRGKTEIGSIIGLITNYGDLNKRNFKIERHGVKNDTKTTYQYYAQDPTPMELEPRAELLGHDLYILQRSQQELQQMLASGEITNPSNTGTGGGATQQYTAQPRNTTQHMF